jgi:PPM family protein phosphatase
MSHTVGCTTHVGKVRDANQDSYAVLRRKDLDNALDGVFIVADGMGGTGGKSGGEVASRTVVETLTDGLVEWAYERGSTDKNADLKPLLTEIIERANNRVWMKQIERTELAGMGTTCLVGALREGVLTLGHAGDSRVYLLRDGKLSQLTQDHSSVWQEVLAGNMTREQAATSKHRNSVTKAIGLKQHDVDPDVQTYELEAGDTLLFCTDGLTVEVPDIEIAKILATFPAAQEASDRLVDAALKRGGSDNVTVIVVRPQRLSRKFRFAPHVLLKMICRPIPIRNGSRKMAVGVRRNPQRLALKPARKIVSLLRASRMMTAKNGENGDVAPQVVKPLAVEAVYWLR